MNRKFSPAGVVAIAAILLLSSCSADKSAQPPGQVSIPVKTMLIEETSSDEVLSYVGFVSAEQIAKLSFKVQGRIDEIFVKEGDFVKKGDALESIETQDLKNSLNISNASLANSKSQLDKAEDALSFSEKNFADMKKLLDEGAVSRNDFEKAELDLDIASSNYRSAVEIHKQSIILKSQNEDMLSEAVLTSPFDGQVIEVLTEKGEMAVPGLPSIVLANSQKTVYAGVSQRDLQKIHPDMEAIVRFEETSIPGFVRSITMIPDSETRTYPVAISIPDSTAPVGAVCDVDIVSGVKTGIRIPIDSILSNGGGYVYVVEDNSAVKRNIELFEIDGSSVFVEGLNTDEVLVVEGMRNLKDGTLVEMKNE